MIVRVCRAAAGLAVALVAWAAPVSAQQAVATQPVLRGTVTTADGGVVNGAEATAALAGGSTERAAITNRHGEFAITGLAAGTYTVTVRAVGFANVVVRNVEIGAAAPAPLRVVMEPAPHETARIENSATVDWIARLPMPSRSVLDYVTFFPGVDTPGIIRGSTVLGLPPSALAITLDGVNIQDNFEKSRDGFFTFVPVRQDAASSVTLVSATQGAQFRGDGAVHIQLVTRSGTNQHRGSAYLWNRAPGLAGTSAISHVRGTPGSTARLNQYGASQGGPIGRSGAAARAFYFVNYEELRLETEIERERTLFSPAAQAGLFTYAGGAVDVLDLAEANGQLATVDPTVAALLAAIRTGAGAGAITNSSDPNIQRAVFQNVANRVDRQPTFRIDYAAGSGHRLSGSFTLASIGSDPDIENFGDPAFPGLPNQRAQESTRYAGQAFWRAQFRRSWVNELRAGGSWGPMDFAPDLSPAQFANQGGFNLSLPLVTNATVANTSTRHEARTWLVEEMLTVPLARHRVSVGATFTQVTAERSSQTMTPTLRFGVDPADQAAGLFTTANFPGASSAALEEASALYALLTGRVTAINGDIRLNPASNTYAFLGPTTERGQLRHLGLFAQDTWRPSPVVTISAGVRWEIEFPFTPLNNVWAAATLLDACGISGVGNGPFGRQCLLFNPGLLIGVLPQFQAFPQGSEGYRLEYGNLAPNLGVAFRPVIETGIVRRILGDPEQATFHGGYSVVFERHGMADYFDLLNRNPGAVVPLDRNASNGNLILDGGPLPLLLRDPARLAPLPPCEVGVFSSTCQQVTPIFPRLAGIGESISIFEPRLERPYTRSYSGGLHRSLGPNATVDLRYIGTRYNQGWVTENFNEPALFESGFLDEFRQAQSNLLANLAQGRGPTFAFFGPDTGTSPLPLYLAFFTGLPNAAAADPSVYAPAIFTNAALIAPLSTINPNPMGALAALLASADRRANALASGLASNFFLLNPDIGTAPVFVTRNAASGHTDSIQVDLQHRLTRGLTLAASYAYTRAWRTTIDSVRFDSYFVRSTDSVPHAVKAAWTYDVPFGRGRAAGSNLGAVADAIVGGWQIAGTARVQSGRQVAQSGIRLVGMSLDELQDLFEPRVDEATGIITLLPDEIILNTRRAFSVDPTSPTGYSALGPPEGRYISPASGPSCTAIFPGDCGEPRQTILRGPIVSRVDLSFRKAFAVGASRSLEFHIDVLNAFGANNFLPVFNPGPGANIFQVNRSLDDLHNTFDPGGRIGQIGVRFRW